MQKHQGQRSVQTPEEITLPSEKLNHHQKPFNWKMAKTRALKKKFTRTISLATCNPDYAIKYPHECRDNPENKLLGQCHPEAIKRIEHDFNTAMQKVEVPTVERPKRTNRL